MAVYVLLIRAIGPETHRRMSMADLRAACERAGLTDVATHGNTGNILCRSALAAAEVRGLVQGVVDGFGVGERCEVFVRTPRQMQAVVRANPFPEAAAERPAAVGVCSFHTTPRWPAWIEEHGGPQRLAAVGAHLVIDYGPSIVAAIDIEKRIGARMTQRNWRVFATLAEKATALDKS